MDSSEQYIKMCEKAEEIQRPLQDWDYGYDPDCLGVDVRVSFEFQHNIHDAYGVPILSEDYYRSFIWLPRQDQLQEMMQKDNIGELFQEFVCFAGGLGPDDSIWLSLAYCDYSWEQLWLAFVMHENYGKVWNGEGWVIA